MNTKEPTWSNYSGGIFKHYKVLKINDYTHQYDIEGYYPFEFVADFSEINIDNLLKIDLAINNQSTIISFPFFPDPDSLDPSHGDPKNKFFRYLFENPGLDDTYLNQISISAYVLGADTPEIYSINLQLSTHNSLYDSTSALNGYFKDIHLLKSRMFGFNDEIIYTFESITPDYLLPVKVNWNAI